MNNIITGVWLGNFLHKVRKTASIAAIRKAPLCLLTPWVLLKMLCHCQYQAFCHCLPPQTTHLRSESCHHQCMVPWISQAQALSIQLTSHCVIHQKLLVFMMLKFVRRLVLQTSWAMSRSSLILSWALWVMVCLERQQNPHMTPPLTGQKIQKIKVSYNVAK